MNKIELHNGVLMPPIVVSTNHMDYDSIKNVMETSIGLGFMGFDTSPFYKTESFLGKAMQFFIANTKYKREDFFITTKVENYQQINGDIEKSVDESLYKLQTDYIDLLLIH